jgi:AraC-like DNA-binding protein
MIKYTAYIPQNRYWANINKAYLSPIHWHDFYEVELVIDGTRTQIVNGIEVPLGPGALTVVSPTDFHRLESDSQRQFNILNICIEPDALSSEMISIFSIYPPPYFLTLDQTQIDKFRDDFEDIRKRIGTPNELNDAIARRKIELILLDTTLLSAKNPLPNPRNQQLSNTFLPVIKHINEHYAEPLRRKQLADIVHMSPSYFGDQFKKSLGVSVVDYITDVRIRKAYSLLKHTEESIHSIIASVGFNSPSLFYRKFFEYYRIRPSDVKRN